MHGRHLHRSWLLRPDRMSTAMAFAIREGIEAWKGETDTPVGLLLNGDEPEGHGR
jgi:hypothetical protein